mgnify:CR=1 FL=1
MREIHSWIFDFKIVALLVISTLLSMEKTGDVNAKFAIFVTLKSFIFTPCDTTKIWPKTNLWKLVMI